MGVLAVVYGLKKKQRDAKSTTHDCCAKRGRTAETWSEPNHVFAPTLTQPITGTVLSLGVWAQKRDLAQSMILAPAGYSSVLYGLKFQTGPEKNVTRKCV